MVKGFKIIVSGECEHIPEQAIFPDLVGLETIATNVMRCLDR